MYRDGIPTERTYSRMNRRYILKLLYEERGYMDVATLLGNYAFPIVACICMALYCKDMQKDHAEEVSKLRDVLERNTVAIEKLLIKLGGGD